MGIGFVSPLNGGGTMVLQGTYNIPTLKLQTIYMLLVCLTYFWLKF